MSYNLLIVTDESDVRNAFLRAFRENHTVHTAESGEEALKVLIQNNIDLVFCDQYLQAMNGIDFLKESIKYAPKTLRILFIEDDQVSANVFVEAVNSVKVYRCIAKPLEAYDLESIVREALENNEQAKKVDEYYRNLEQRNQELRETLTSLKRNHDELVSSERLSTINEIASKLVFTSKNPVFSIKEKIEKILGTGISEENRNDANSILASAEQLDKLVREVTEYTRDKKPRLTDEDVNEVIKEVLSTLIEELRQHKIDLSLNLDEYIGKVPVDREQIKLILLNLFRNSIDAMQDGGRLQIKSNGYGDRVKVFVVDNGTGINSEELENIFIPFFTTKSNANGLGLANVKKIVEAHGGKVSFESKSIYSYPEDHGTTFTLELYR